jgi:hypothetical protein
MWRKPVYWLLFFLLLGMGVVSSVRAEQQYASGTEDHENPSLRQAVVQSALDGLKSVVALWGAQDFSALYESGTMESKQLFSKERFINLMKNSSRQLQCCWTTLQGLQGFLKSPTQVYVKAKLGYENFHNTELGTSNQDTGPSQWVISSSFDPRTFLMVLQQDRWRIDLAEILLASGYLLETLQIDRVESSAPGPAMNHDHP